MIHANSSQKKPDRLLIDDLVTSLPNQNVDLSANQLFKAKSTHDFNTNINLEDKNDPIALQITPNSLELINEVNFVDDPVGDSQAMKVPGLLHKYKNRVLLITTGSCAIHCRYCFRRNFNYQNSVSKPAFLREAINYIKKNKQIKEVILSGGDPLTLNNDHLFTICDAIKMIKHVTTIRFHSRYPVVSFNRFDNEFINYFNRYPLKKVFVSHINHPNELSKETHLAFQKLRKIGFTLLNQSVLLKNINNNANCLIKLSNQLFDQGVIPYYLHLLDHVKGAGHFLTNPDENEKIFTQLQINLPGYLVPKMVREISGEKSKTCYSKNSF